MQLTHLTRVGKAFSVSAGVILASAVLATPASAQEGVSAPSVSVVASGLDNPRGLGFSQSGALFVAEAGRGGSEPCVPNPEGGVRCYGATGAITRIFQGQQERIATDLPSLADGDGSAATGPHDVSTAGSEAPLLTIGLGGAPATREALGSMGDQFGRLVRVGPDGTVAAIADLVGYEASANPDEGDVDSNPYGLLEFAQEVVVADAGANAVVAVGADGQVSTLAVFPDTEVAPPFPNAPDPFLMQAVPTTVARGPDGALYVGRLTGFPFPVGAAGVYRVVPGQAPSLFAAGFTTIIDLAFAPDGSLYVLEMAANGLRSDDPTGALVQVGPDGSRETILSDPLNRPGGVTVGPDGALYVTNHSISAGAGEVLRVELPS